MRTKAPKLIYPNGGFWYIRYKDPTSLKWKAVSTRLKATTRNMRRAQEMRTKIMEEIQSIEVLRYREGDIESAFKRFREVNSTKSVKTRETYEVFHDYLIQKIAPDFPCNRLDKEKSESFLLWLNKLDNISQNTKYGIQKNFLKFLKFLFEYEYIPRMFIINKDVKTRAKVIEPLIFSDEDRQIIIDALTEDKGSSILKTRRKEGKEYKKKRRPFVYVKNSNFRTMIMLLLYTGLRPSDIIDVTVEHIDLNKMEIKYYSSKTDKWFVRPLHSMLKDVLEQRIKEVGTGKIFDYGDVKNMGKAFNRYMEALGLDNKGYTLRTFRKDFISRSQEAGLSISTTAVLVGHSNIKTTMTYYTKLSSQHLKTELAKLK